MDGQGGFYVRSPFQPVPKRYSKEERKSGIEAALLVAELQRREAKRIRKELGDRLIERTDSIFLNDWLDSFVDKADTWMKWRYVFFLLWKPRGTAMKASTSRKRASAW